MPQTQIQKIQALVVAVEATEGTDAVPDAANDAVQLIEPATIAFGAEQSNARPGLVNDLLDEAAPVQPGAKWCEITGQLHIRGAGAAYDAGTKPEPDAINQAAGMRSTLDATGGAEDYTYDTISASMKTVTCYGYQALETGVWVRHDLLAGRASRVAWRFPAGSPGIYEFTIRGKYVEPTDDAPDNAPSYQTTVAPNFGAATGWQIGAFTTAVVRDATVAIENTLAPRLSGNAADGLAGYIQTARRVTFGATFEGMRITDYNQFTKWTGATAEALRINCPGGTGTQYNRLQIDADKATILDAPAYQDVNGVMHVSLSGLCSPEGTNRSLVTYD